MTHSMHTDLEHRMTRLHTALGVLERRIQRAAQHGLDADTVRSLHDALNVVSTNLDDHDDHDLACRHCGRPATPARICTKCCAQLSALTALELD